MSRYDVIVIGSGIGGLSAALTVARVGKSVLVLEGKEIWATTEAINKRAVEPNKKINPDVTRYSSDPKPPKRPSPISKQKTIQSR
ncbi:FAD-binding protein [bacterium]|nr:FAD-binding protein [bacterium]